MARKQPIGHMACPECGMDGAEVKAQKNGLLYRWCEDCGAQYFPRDLASSERLRAKMTPVTVTDTDGQDGGPELAPVPEPEKNPAARGGFDMGAL